jgi:hypothetical protein
MNGSEMVLVESAVEIPVTGSDEILRRREAA